MSKLFMSVLKLVAIVIISALLVCLSEPIKSGTSQIVDSLFAMQLLGVVAAVVFVVTPIMMAELDKIMDVARNNAQPSKRESIEKALSNVKQEIKDDTYALFFAFVIVFVAAILLEINIPFIDSPIPQLKRIICSVVLLSCMMTALVSAFDLIRALFQVFMSKAR